MAERRGHQSWDGHRPYDSSCSSLPVKDSWNVQPKDIGQRRPERVIAKPWMEKKNRGGIAMLSLSPHSALIAGIVRLSIQESRVQTVGKMMKRLMVLQPQWCFDGIYQTVIIWYTLGSRESSETWSRSGVQLLNPRPGRYAVFVSIYLAQDLTNISDKWCI